VVAKVGDIVKSKEKGLVVQLKKAKYTLDEDEENKMGLGNDDTIDDSRSSTSSQ